MTEGASLSKELHGPDLTDTLIGLLLSLWKERVAAMADTEAIFHEAFVNEDYKDCLRFLWGPEGDTSKEPEVHMKRVYLFDAVSSHC